MKVDWKGIYPAITTKFDEQGSPDYQSFKKNLEAQLNAGIHGVVLGGTLGEASTLTNDEKLRLIDETLHTVGDSIPVILNIAEQKTSDAVQAAENAQQNGASGLMMLPPMRYKADDRETTQFFREVAGSTDLPIMIYNNPVDYGIEVKLDMFDELLGDFANIEAVKDSTRDTTNVTRMINRFSSRLKILCGVDTLALESLYMGGDGWVGGLVCAFPRETVAIYELVQQGRYEEALKIFRWFLPLLELDITPKLVQNIKLAEVATNLGTEYVRKPRLQLAGEERRRVEKTINDALEKRTEIEHLL